MNMLLAQSASLDGAMSEGLNENRKEQEEVAADAGNGTGN
jgi:hypothetical protein